MNKQTCQVLPESVPGGKSIKRKKADKGYDEDAKNPRGPPKKFMRVPSL